MKKLGLVLAAVGGLILLFSFASDTAPEGTYNIGLLQGQMMQFSFGSLLLLIGALVGAVGHVLTRMEEAGLLPPPGVTVAKPNPSKVK